MNDGSTVSHRVRDGQRAVVCRPASTHMGSKGNEKPTRLSPGRAREANVPVFVAGASFGIN